MENKTRFVHFRFFNPFNGAIEGRGGVTYAYRENDDGTVRYSYAQCSLKDNYDKRVGRALAEERLDVEGKFWTAESEDTVRTFPNNLSSYLERYYAFQGIPVARKFSRKNRRSHKNALAELLEEAELR